jgi:hypothetical protein
MRSRRGPSRAITSTLAVAVAALGLLYVQAADGATKRTFVALTDSYVTSKMPRRNFGSASELRLDRSPVTRSYLTFNVRELAGRVTRVFLFVYAKNGPRTGYDVRGVRSRAWSERTITYRNAPGLTSAVASSRRIRTAGWTRVEVTRLVRRRGLLSLALTTSSRSTLRLASSETARSPQLVVQTDTAPPSVSSTTYYVDKVGGNDANTGASATAAWKTLAKANSAPLGPGNRLLLKRGSIWTGSLRIANSGSSSDPITIGAYGTGVLPVVQGASSCIVLSGSYLVLQEVRAYDCSWAGIDVSGNNNRVEYSASARNVVGVDVRAGALNNTLWANELVDNNKMSVLTPTPTSDDSGAFGVALHGDGTDVAFNTIVGSDAFSYDFGRDGAAVEVYGGRSNDVHHNLGIDNRDFTELGDSRAANNVFAENVVRSSLASSTFLITRGAASGNGPVLGTEAYSNTVVLTGGASQGFVCYAGCSADVLRMRGNVLQAAWKVGYADAPFDEDNDLLSGGIVQFTKGVNSIVANPRFVDPASNNFHLKSSSPAIDRGVDTGQVMDYDKHVIPVDGDGDGVARPDIGAFEYHGSTPAPADTTPRRSR